jgi:uncharacterized protein
VSEATHRVEIATLPPLPSQSRLQDLLFDAARLGREDMLAPLIAAGAAIEAGDARGHSPLVLASYHGHADATARLLALGAHPDGDGDHAGNTALMGVAFKGHLHIARALLEAGADPDARNGAGQTALMMAALFGRTAMVTLLLDAGADATIRDVTGKDAAALACDQGNADLAARITGLSAAVAA